MGNAAKLGKLTSVVVTDCGSTTTKARLFERNEHRWAYKARGEAPTTVEAPLANVTIGVKNSVLELSEVTGRNFLGEDGAESPWNPAELSMYLSTSSAGGGLQMLVAGGVKSITTQSAERAALGAGAIVLDVLSVDDTREDYEVIRAIRHLKPDIILLAGGVDGGAVNFSLQHAEILRAASPKPRFGDSLKIPVIFAGNAAAQAALRPLLEGHFNVIVVENVRPTLERETIGPARDAIHDLFLTHVMSHSPGYETLLKWSEAPILPTPSAVGDMIKTLGRKRNKSVLCVDIGGATTDIFSMFRDVTGDLLFNRTVSANYGMSYSIAHVLLEAGVDRVLSWLPFSIPEHVLRDRIRNKMVRPTTIPQTMEDLCIEQALCREALRLSLEHHRSLAVGLTGVKKQRTIGDIFQQKRSTNDLVNLLSLDMVIGSGGVISHAPDRKEAAMMLVDGFGLSGITEIYTDSVFLLPHLGAFAQIEPQGALEILEEDCLLPIAVIIAPVFSRDVTGNVAEVWLDDSSLGFISPETVNFVAASGTCVVRVVPLHRSVDIGAGPGKTLTKEVFIGSEGIILDGRNRPLVKGKQRR